MEIEDDVSRTVLQKSLFEEEKVQEYPVFIEGANAVQKVADSVLSLDDEVIETADVYPEDWY